MFIFTIAFTAGVLFLQTFTQLPETYWLFILGILLIGILIFFKLTQKKILRIVFLSLMSFLIGFIWCLGYVYHKTQWKLPDDMEGKTVTAWGKVDSIPTISNHFMSFQFIVHKLKLDNETYHGKARVRLTGRSKAPLEIHIGDEWRLRIRLKKIHSLSNPGGFDFEAYALEEGVRAAGYVVPKEPQLLLGSVQHSFGRLRETLKSLIDKHLPVSETSHWIPALVVGERHNIDQSQWEILRNTGTNHLMAIAGLHIGFMSGFIYFLVNRLWRYTRFTLILPAQQAASLAALGMALFYSALAGFSLPTQRACIMLSVFLLTQLIKIKTSTWHAWSMALVIVLIINPLSVLSESFWLSFGAVALIIYGTSGRLSAKGLWSKWGRLQWVTAIGLIPFCLWLFQQCSLVSFAANALAIPWVGFIIVPLSLLGSFLLFVSVKTGSALLFLADTNLSLLWKMLTWVSDFPWATWFQPIDTPWMLITSLIAILFLLLPAGFPGRLLGFIWLIPLFMTQSKHPNYSEMYLTLLDVGQGLSTVVQTERHVLVYDAGAKLSSNYDMGESVVVPYLHNKRIKKIDMFVISHGDNDHIGGAAAILQRFPVTDIRTSVPDKIPGHDHSRLDYCLQGQSWEWDGVKFTFLYPDRDHLDKGNNSSCVLSISNGVHQILLTGDIEKQAEKYLVKTAFDELPSTILIAPHHGSKTSAVESFLDQVHPRYVLFPIGYRNRYHFPHPSVVEKYDELGSIKLDSADDGAIHFWIHSEIQCQAYRRQHQHYWLSL